MGACVWQGYALGYSVYSLYWYKSTNADSEGGAAEKSGILIRGQIEVESQRERELERQRSPYSIYSLYWYKSTTTDAEGAEKVAYRARVGKRKK